jgi:hypothetical protein
LRAPSCDNCSKNDFPSSFARSSSEITLLSYTGASFLYGVLGRGRTWFFFSLKGCAFLYLFIHKIRLYFCIQRSPVLRFLQPFAGNPKLSRRDADDPIEVKRKPN